MQILFSRKTVLFIIAGVFIFLTANVSFADNNTRPQTPPCASWACHVNPATGEMICPAPCNETPGDPGTATAPEPLTLLLVGGGFLGGVLTKRNKKS